MSLSPENKALIERVTGRSWITARSMLIAEVGISQLLDAARQEGARGGEPVAATNMVGAAEAEVGRYIYRRIEALMGAKPGTVEGAELTYLSEIAERVEEYGEGACAGHSLASFLASPAEPYGWRSIESAPKDGTRFLSFGRMGTHPGDWSIAHYDPANREYFGVDIGNPTHWMPLPLPPTSEGGGA